MPPAARERNRRGEGERLREDIIEAATALMERAGCDEGLTLRGTARAVGVSPQAMYLHFDDLTTLVLAVLGRCHALMSSVMEAAAAEWDDPVERVLARGRAYITWGMANPGLYQVMYEGRVQAVHEPGEVPPGRKVLWAVRDDVTAAMASGRIPEGDAGLIAVQLWALVHGLVSLRANKPHFPWPDPLALADAGGRRIMGVGAGS